MGLYIYINTYSLQNELQNSQGRNSANTESYVLKHTQNAKLDVPLGDRKMFYYIVIFYDWVSNIKESIKQLKILYQVLTYIINQ